VSVQGSASVGVKIRLSEVATAQLWIGHDCSAPPNSTHTIEQSGTYAIPISRLPGNGGMVCLISAEDGLMQAVPLHVPNVAESVRCTNSTCYSM